MSTQDCDQDKRGVRCVQVSPDETFIASGDRSGNIRVHNAKNYTEQCKIEAHEAEIMTLKFSQDTKYLASGSRDRLVHMFDGENNFEFLTTVEDHSSCVTSVDFIKNSQEEDLLVTSGKFSFLIFISKFYISSTLLQVQTDLSCAEKLSRRSLGYHYPDVITMSSRLSPTT